MTALPFQTPLFSLTQHHSVSQLPHQVTAKTTAPLLRNVEQPGLEWKEDLFSCKSHWTKEPSVAVIKKLIVQHLDLQDKYP
jgi:hypothetical protein